MSIALHVHIIKYVLCSQAQSDEGQTDSVMLAMADCAARRDMSILNCLLYHPGASQKEHWLARLFAVSMLKFCISQLPILHHFGGFLCTLSAAAQESGAGLPSDKTSRTITGLHK